MLHAEAIPDNKNEKCWKLQEVGNSTGNRRYSCPARKKKPAALLSIAGLAPIIDVGADAAPASLFGNRIGSLKHQAIPDAVGTWLGRGLDVLGTWFGLGYLIVGR